MRHNFDKYIKYFRALIVRGFQVVKSKDNSIYYWIYPYTLLPTKYRFSEVLQICNLAKRTKFGSTSKVAIHFNLLYPREYIWHAEDSGGKSKD